MKCSTSKASSVAAWSFSSSETRPRQKSDERTSVGLKCVARERRLAGAGGADQHDERRAPGSRACTRSSREDRHLRRRAERRRPRRRPAGSAPRSRSRSATPSAQACELGARPLEAVVAVAEAARPAGPRTARCTRRSASSRRPSRGRACSNSDALEGRAAAAGRGARSTSTTRGRVEAREPRVAVGQRAVAAARCARAARGGMPVEPQPLARRSRARAYETSTPDDLASNARLLEQRAQQLALAAAEVEHARRAALRAAPRRPRRAAARCRLQRLLDGLLLGALRVLGLVVGVGAPRRRRSRASASRASARWCLR